MDRAVLLRGTDTSSLSCKRWGFLLLLIRQSCPVLLNWKCLLFGFVWESAPARKKRGHFPTLEVLCTPWAVSDVAGQAVSLVHIRFCILKLPRADGTLVRPWLETLAKYFLNCKCLQNCKIPFRTVPKSNNINIRWQNESKPICACPFIAWGRWAIKLQQ